MTRTLIVFGLIALISGTLFLGFHMGTGKNPAVSLPRPTKVKKTAPVEFTGNVPMNIE